MEQLGLEAQAKRANGAVGIRSPIPVNESQKLVKSKVVSNIGSLCTLYALISAR